MKTPRIILTIAALSSCSIHLQTLASDPEKSTTSSLYINNLHIVDIRSGQIIKDRQLQISDGKIIAIKPAQTPVVDNNSIYHDAQGYYVTPGLIDMHIHAYDPAAFTIALSHGVTHVRLLNGVKEQLLWRKELEDGRRIGSTLTVSSPIISGFRDAHMHRSAHTPTEAINAVIAAKQQGYDLIKAYGNLTAPVLKALLAEAKRQQIPVAKHGPHPAAGMDWKEVAELQSLEHVEDIYQGPLNYKEDQQKLDDTIIQLKMLDTPITPTLNIFWHLTQISEYKHVFLESLPQDYISPIFALEEKHNQVERWLNSPDAMIEHNKKTLAFLQEITHQLYKAGVTLLVGSDSGTLLSPHGLATHTEMELMQQAGLPAIAVLRAATMNAAQTLGKELQLGQVAVGYNADMVLSAQNPLENVNVLRHPEWVIKNGRLFSANELKKLREDAIAKRSFWQEMRTLLKAGDNN